MSFISTWTQGIIVSVIIATIIEMILPLGNNGKYVKVIIGIFVLFNIITPVINKLNLGGDNALSDFTSVEASSKNITQQTQKNSISLSNEEVIRKMYDENLKVDIKSKISQKGYEVGNINLEILNNNEYTLNKIEIKITGRKEENAASANTKQRTTTIVENIQNIKVSLGGSSKDKEEKEQSILSEVEKKKLKEYLSSVYEVKEENILIS